MSADEARVHLIALTGGPSCGGVILISPERRRRLSDWFGDDLSWDELIASLREIARG